MSNKVKATEIQKFIDWEYNIDIAAFQTAELKRLATEIQKFLELGVDTDDLDLAENFLQNELDALEEEDEFDDEFDTVDELDFDDVIVEDVVDEDEII